jgi:hypothetical protein
VTTRPPPAIRVLIVRIIASPTLEPARRSSTRGINMLLKILSEIVMKPSRGMTHSSLFNQTLKTFLLSSHASQIFVFFTTQSIIHKVHSDTESRVGIAVNLKKMCLNTGTMRKIIKGTSTRRTKSRFGS